MPQQAGFATHPGARVSGFAIFGMVVQVYRRPRPILETEKETLSNPPGGQPAERSIVGRASERTETDLP
jgi:hypothetical protein